MKIAVVLFAYKRQQYLRQAINSHTKLQDVDYCAFIDDSDEWWNTRYTIWNSGKYDYIIHRERHCGLNKNIIEGLNELFLKYDVVIVLEDDIVLKGDALIYLKTYLELLKDIKHIGAVSCKKESGFLHKGFYCWGWGTWKDRWDSIQKELDINGKSWDLQVFDYFIKNGLYTYCSPIKRSKHIGTNGVHYKWYSKLSVRGICRKLAHSFSF